jgi:hypothetical protein
MPGFTVDLAMGYWGDLGLEVLKPRGLRPGGAHQRFLDKHGNGLQHVNLASVANYSALVDTLKKRGISREFSTQLSGGKFAASYLATQELLGGFQMELTGAP